MCAEISPYSFFVAHIPTHTLPLSHMGSAAGTLLYRPYPEVPLCDFY